MLKAKELAVSFQTSSDKVKELIEIVKALYMEVKTIADMRNARKDESICAIFREQNRKWIAFVGKVGNPRVREEGFRLYVNDVSPEIYKEVWGNDLPKLESPLPPEPPEPPGCAVCSRVPPAARFAAATCQACKNKPTGEK